MALTGPTRQQVLQLMMTYYGCALFRPILFVLQTATYKPTKFLLPILESLTTNKYKIKDLFNFATKIVEQDSSNFMGSIR